MTRQTQDPGRAPSDERLGLNRDINRRDFVQGALAGAVGLALGSAAWAQEGMGSLSAQASVYYPPRLTGLRGSAPGTFETAHAKVAGSFQGSELQDAGRFDLVVVGAGISGLSAAHFYLKRYPNARILILDNHDDFGGHARRNEFTVNGTTRLMNGGTFAIESPRPYSAVADGLLKDIGIDATVEASRIMHPEVYKEWGLTHSIYFDEHTFGRSTLLNQYGHQAIEQWVKRSPLNAKAQAAVIRIERGGKSIWTDLSSDERKRKLKKISYAQYLQTVLAAPPEVVALYQSRTQGEWGVGADAVSALDAWGIGLPGFKSLHLAPGSIPGMGFTPAGYADTGGSTFLHFPDGNATIARGLVRRLIPSASETLDLNGLVNVPLQYEALDPKDRSQAVRLRLSSMVVEVDPTDSANGVTRVLYQQQGQTHVVQAKHCVLACYNMIIPYLMPSLPLDQKEALHRLVKTPLVYTSVAIQNWWPWARLKTHDIHAPNGFHTTTRLSLTSDVGEYKSPRHPKEPHTLWMVRTPCHPGLSEHEQNKAGRAELLATSFEVFEREIRAQLNQMLGSHGFDAARDITAITVNRWPHGYAPEHNSLFESEEGPTPQEIARRPFKGITIANSDSGGGAYTDVAIEQAYRAVNELAG